MQRYNPKNLSESSALRIALDKYAQILNPWAHAKAATVIAEINQADKRAWATATDGMAFEIRKTIQDTPIGDRVRELMNEQVKLITSLPRKAAERVHELVLSGVENSSRGKDVEKEILRTGEVTASKATLIARTETSRVGTVLTQARAEHVGSDGYIWRTVHDSDVRESHKKMDGKYVAWSTPPTLDGLTGHAGSLPNCRCYPEPVLPHTIDQE